MASIRFLNYRLFIWILLVFAVVMGGISLLIAYSYDIQTQSNEYIDRARKSAEETMKMKTELAAIRGITYTYIFNKSNRWIDSLGEHRKNLIIILDRARLATVREDEKLLIQRMSALFLNFEQNLASALEFQKKGDVATANKLLQYTAQELLETIEQKADLFIEQNKQVEKAYLEKVERNNALMLNILTFLGVGGIIFGVLLGWLINRLLISPINQLILTVRSASGQTVLDSVKIHSKNDLEELEDRIRELIERMNLAQKDIDRKNQLLQHSNKFAAIGKIAPTIAHEIRNPLAAIKMLTYSIKESPNISADIAQDLEIILGEIQRLESFTKNFLKFAKPSPPVYEQNNPLTALEEVIRLLTPRFKENGIQLHQINTTVDCKVMSDLGQLKQIYLNILLNAIDVMPNGGTIELEARVETVENPQTKITGQYLVIEIRDSGPGIPPAIMPYIFEPYFKKSDQGVGLGLSISQSIANNHGGWISAANKQIGSGAVFCIYFPLLIVT